MTQNDNLYNPEHKSVIMWRGKVFEFTEPVDEEALTAFFQQQ